MTDSSFCPQKCSERWETGPESHDGSAESVNAGKSNELSVVEDRFPSDDGTAGCVPRTRAKGASGSPSVTTVIGSDGGAKELERRSKRVSFTELGSEGAKTGTLECRSKRGDNSLLDVSSEGGVAASEVLRSQAESKVEPLFSESWA